MRFLLIPLAALFLIPAARAGDADDVKAAIDALNKAFEKADAAAIKAGMADDHVSVTSNYGGPATREQQIKSLGDMKLTEYKADKMKVSLLGKDAALVTYTVTQKGTFKGKPLPAAGYASAVWVKKDGRWVERHYQETDLPAK